MAGMGSPQKFVQWPVLIESVTAALRALAEGTASDDVVVVTRPNGTVLVLIEIRGASPPCQVSDTPSPDRGGVGGAFRDLDLERPDDLLKYKDPPTRKGGAAPSQKLPKVRDRSKILAKIPPRAWAAADYLRDQLIKQDPHTLVANQPWGPSVETGWRFLWANAIRLMVDNDKRGLTVDAYYDEVAKTLKWVFEGQGHIEAKYRTIVESGDALRTKWEKIQRHRRLGVAPVVRPAAPSSVVQVKRTFV